jgi:hypothetical protein
MDNADNAAVGYLNNAPVSHLAFILPSVGCSVSVVASWSAIETRLAGSALRPIGHVPVHSIHFASGRDRRTKWPNQKIGKAGCLNQRVGKAGGPNQKVGGAIRPLHPIGVAEVSAIVLGQHVQWNTCNAGFSDRTISMSATVSPRARNKFPATTLSRSSKSS